MRIGVLDQSPVISGHSPAQAVHETIRLVKAAGQLGHHRHWLARRSRSSKLLAGAFGLQAPLRRGAGASP